MAKTLNYPDEVMINIPQTDFFDVLRDSESDFSKEFTVKAIDDGDVLSVGVSLTPRRPKNPNQVGFKFVENLTEDDKETLQLIASEVFSELGDSDTSQIVFLIGASRDDHIKAYIRKNSTDLPKETKVILQPSKDLLYSRHRGILESSVLEKKKVGIIGLGSGGSSVAIELAKAGVGHFVLIDYDRIELNNIIRHTCGVSDLGRFKTKAVRELILEKNPFAEVTIHNIDINDLRRAASDEIGLKECDLLIGATDSSRSRLNINELAFEFKIPALFGKCKTRAAGGDVVVVRPGKGPCFRCICGGTSHDEEVSSLRQAREANPAYVSDTDVEATIQVGLSSDIIPISNMVVKIALVELCKESDSALVSLEEEFRSSYYVWANRTDADYEENGLEDHEKTSILRWYADPNSRRDEKCKICNGKEEDGESSDENDY